MQYQALLKIMIVFAYFLLLVLFVISRESVYLAKKDAIIDAIDKYFLCEAIGHVPGRCSREFFEQYSYLGLDFMFYFIILLLPIVNLVFLINFTLLREKLSKLNCGKLLSTFRNRVC